MTTLDQIREAARYALALDAEHGSSPHMDGTFEYRLRVSGVPGIKGSLRTTQSTAELFAAAPHLLAALEAVNALHKPEKRWMPYEGAGVSYDTEREALEATEDADLNQVALEELATNGVPFFEVCAHCKHIEDSPCEGECTLEAGYRESIWPCPTVKSIATALGSEA